jgi:hypothetical protein
VLGLLSQRDEPPAALAYDKVGDEVEIVVVHEHLDDQSAMAILERSE